MKRLLFLFFCLWSFTCIADGLQGWSYTTYIGGGASPNINNLTPITTGTTTSINYNWGGGLVLDSGRYDGVIIHFQGYIQAPTTGTYYFGTQSDDGSQLTINGTIIDSCWCEQGPTFRSGSIYLTAGQVIPADIWYYENGGGAVIQFYWYTNNSWQIVPASMMATTSTYFVPQLCCGGGSAPFNANLANVMLVNNFIGRTTNDSQVYIQQVGDGNVITVDQTGTKNNYAYISNSGSNNSIAVTQSGNPTTQVNYSRTVVNGNSNNVAVTQNSTGGAKGAFVNVADHNNSVTLTQSDSGNHYAEIGLTGGNKTVNVTQSGSAGQMTSIQLSGQPTGITLQQTGTTQQFYSIQFNCATAGGCAPINVKQGN